MSDRGLEREVNASRPKSEISLGVMTVWTRLISYLLYGLISTIQ